MSKSQRDQRNAEAPLMLMRVRAEAAEDEVARLRGIIAAKDDLLVAYRTGNHRKAGKAIDKLAALAKEDA